MLLLYSLRPDVIDMLRPLSEWVWHYLLVDDTTYLPNTNELSMYERRHLLDVKHVLLNVYALWCVSVACGVLSLLAIAFVDGWRRIKDVMHTTALLGLVLTLLAGVLAAFDFYGHFHQLHGLFFKANTWVFAETSTIIQLFPLAYFQTFAAYWGALNIAVFSLLLLLARR